MTDPIPTPTETHLVMEIGDTSWRLNRIPLLEAELFSQNPNPQPRRARPAPYDRISWRVALLQLETKWRSYP
jgi:hypothetical protein